jgi:RNA polymerase sigma factor (sigma-70 family)
MSPAYCANRFAGQRIFGNALRAPLEKIIDAPTAERALLVVAMTNRLRETLEHLYQLAPADGDGQLLARFVAARDECAFAALVHRHGPMVLGVCRRLLQHEQDAEDAFQATFLVLARRARSVVKRESVGSWLYGVAYRIALQAKVVRARRRAREKQVAEMPHPEVRPAEPQDWLPILDRELARLPEKYRAALVLCDLEGLPRKEAASQLGVPEGTLSSRLATARQLLAKRLARYGLGLPAAALGEGAARAVPAPLVDLTVNTAGQSVVVSPTVSLLTNGVLKTMLLKKLKLVLALLMVVGVLGATGLAYRTGGQATAADKPTVGKPTTEVEALRKEVELLRLNLLVVLEKVSSQEAELRAFRRQGGAPRGDSSLPGPHPGLKGSGLGTPMAGSSAALPSLPGDNSPPQADPLKQAEDALKALRSARDPETRRKAEDALQKALARMRSGKHSTGEFRNDNRFQDELPR